MKLTIENCVQQVIDLNPVNTRQVLEFSSNLAVDQKWKRKGINRMSVFFRVCNALNYDNTDLKK